MKTGHWKILCVLLAIVIIWLSLCNTRKEPTDSPKTNTSNQYREKLVRDSAAEKRFKDSMIAHVVAPALADAAFWEDQYKREVNHSNTQADVFNDILNKECPDTSGRVKAAYNNLLSSHAKAISKCDSTIAANKKAIAGQAVIIKADSNSLATLRSDFRQALRTQDTLQDYIDKIRPRRSISLGIAGSVSDQFNGFGPAIGYQDKKGNQLDYALLFINGFKVKQHTVTLKKVLLRL